MKPLSERYSEIVGIVNVGRGDETYDVFAEVVALESRTEMLEKALRVAQSRIGHGNACTDHTECRIISAALAAEKKKPLCAHCGKPESNSKHVRYGPDLDNPVKHEFEVALAAEEVPDDSHT